MCPKREERYIFYSSKNRARAGIFLFKAVAPSTPHGTNALILDGDELHIIDITAFCWPLSQPELEHPKPILAAIFRA